MKKFISMVLILTLALSSFGSVFAASKKVVFKVDDEYQRIMVEETDEGTFTHTLDKKLQILTTELRDENNRIIDTQVIDLTQFQNKIKSATTTSSFIENQNDKEVLISRSTHYQNTLLNYEYKRRGSYNVEYTLRKKSTYKTLPLEGNETAIDQYVSAVDTLNAAEITVIAAMGYTGFWTIATYLDGGLTSSQAATAAGGFVVELTALWAAETNCKSKWSIWIE